MTTRAGSAGLTLLVCFLACGCGKGIDRVPTEAEKVADLRLMLPNKVEIEPFTSIRSFDDDEMPDGILLVLRPVDSFGDPVKAAGHFYFELWTEQLASGERKGERLAFWERDIANESDMRLYWTHAQMFEFQLAWTGQGSGKIQPGRKFILRAVWRTPWNETVSDEYKLDFNLPFPTLTGRSAEAPAGGNPAGGLAPRP
jgi:hypothetical protein